MHLAPALGAVIWMCHEPLHISPMVRVSSTAFTFPFLSDFHHHSFQFVKLEKREKEEERDPILEVVHEWDLVRKGVE